MLTRAHIDSLRPQLGALAAEAVIYANEFKIERTWMRIQSRGPGGSQTAKGQRPDVHMVHMQTAMNADAFPAFGVLFSASEQLADSDVLFTDADEGC